MITIVSLGTEQGDLTARGLTALKRADTVLVRNADLPSAQSLILENIPFEGLGYVFEKSRSFETLTQNLVREIVKRAKGKELCYCVDGGVCEDRAAQILLKRKDAVAVEGTTKAAKAAARAGLCGAYCAVSAYEALSRKLSLPLVVYDLHDKLLACDIKLALSETFGDDAPALYIDGETQKKIPLYEADRQEKYGAGTALVLFEQPLLEKKKFDADDLLAILRRLRAPDGCPWDKVQTHESIRINAIEEAYELVDAIDLKDPDKIREEAGDVFMQAAFHTLIEEERGNFTAADVFTEVCEKLITRHTHVFGKDTVKDDAGALSVWEKNKMTEKHQTTYSDAVNDVPQCFPALLRAQKIVKRTAKGGWKVGAYESVIKKLDEELALLGAAAKEGGKEETAKKLGEAFMTLARLAYLLGVDGEQALLDAVKDTAARYTEWERLVLADGKDVNALTEEERAFYDKRAKENVSRD